MAQERTYDSQIGPQAAPMREALATPASYGAGLGDAVQRAGQQLHENQVRAFQVEEKRKQDSELADWNRVFAEHRINMGDIVRKKRAEAGPGAAGHTAEVRAANEAAREALLSRVTDQKVRRLAEQQWREYDGKLADTEGDFEEGKRIAKVVTDTSDAIDLEANGVRLMTGEDPKAYADALKRQYDIIDRSTTDAATKDKLRKYADAKISTGFIQHLQDTNPRAARAVLDSGQFNHLDPALLEQLRSGADVEIRRADAADAAEVAAQKAAYTEKLATVKKRADAGEDVSDELPGLATAASAFGDTSGLEDLKKIDRENRYAKIYDGAPPMALQSRIIELQKIAESKRTPEQQAELKWLVEKAPAKESAWNNDPVSVVIRNGRPGEQPPVLDPANPASYAERAAWTKRAARQYGSMQPLSDPEVQARRVRYRQGINGQKEAADDLAQFGPGMSRLAALQLAPNDKFLHEVVRLPADTRDDAYEGKAAYAADKTLLKTWNSTDDEEHALRVKDGFDKALASVPTAQRNAIVEIAWNLAAAEVKRGQPLTGALFEKSLNRAIGADYRDGKQRGGIAGWTGRQFFVVPDGYTANAFATELFNWVRKYPGEAPVNPNGTNLDLKLARPVRLQNGMYKFMVGDRDVKNKKGGLFVYQPGWR